MKQPLPWKTQVDISTCPFPFSVSMTTCSTLLALGMMPLCLLIYTKMWVDSGTIIIPYDNIGKSLLCKISEYYSPALCLPPAGFSGQAQIQLVFASDTSNSLCPVRISLQATPDFELELAESKFQAMTPWEKLACSSIEITGRGANLKGPLAQLCGPEEAKLLYFP